MRTPRGSRALPVIAALAALCLFPPPASAHGLVGRTDLPVPPWLFAWAASIVLVLSFAALAILWPRPRLERPREHPLFTVPAWAEPLAGAVGVASFILVVCCGFAGSQDQTANLTPTFVWVYFWVGLAFASAIAGDVFRPLNPWRAAARGVAWLACRAGVGHHAATYPAPLGYWPAAAGLFAFAWCELGLAGRDQPATLGILIMAYAAAQLLGMWRYGIEPWCSRADALGVYFGLIARLAPLAARERTIVARAPLSGATRLELAPGVVAVLVVMLGATTFDGFTNGSIWKSLETPGANALRSLGLGPGGAAELLALIGLTACTGLVLGIYRAGIAGARSTKGGRHRARLDERFAHTLLPIALAYVVAHYFSLLVFQGQAGVALASDPFGTGNNVLGTADWTVNYNAISTQGIWYIQVAALLAGHIGGLILAHDRSLALWSDGKAAVQSQYWMLTVMVGYTSLGLWLLSAVAT